MTIEGGPSPFFISYIILVQDNAFIFIAAHNHSAMWKLPVQHMFTAYDKRKQKGEKIKVDYFRSSSENRENGNDHPKQKFWWMASPEQLLLQHLLKIPQLHLH